MCEAEAGPPAAERDQSTDRPTIGQILRQYGPAYRAKYAAQMSSDQLRVMDQLEGCRTGELGYAVYRCDSCGAVHTVPQSCGNRHCPLCQGHKAKQWLEKQLAKLLPPVPALPGGQRPGRPSPRGGGEQGLDRPQPDRRRRTASPPLPGALCISRGDQQSPSGPMRTRTRRLGPRHLHLPQERQPALAGHDGDGRGVHPAVPAARPATRSAEGPPFWLRPSADERRSRLAGNAGDRHAELRVRAGRGRPVVAGLTAADLPDVRRRPHVPGVPGSVPGAMHAHGHQLAGPRGCQP